MTALSPSTYLTDPATTEGNFQTGIGNLQAFVTELLGGAPAEALTIASGLITPTKAFLISDTEAAASTDDLTNITATNHPDGRVIALTCANAARVVTVKNLATGSGQIQLRDAVDAVLDTTDKVIFLRRLVSTDRWVEVWRNWGVGPVQTADIAAVCTKLGIRQFWCGTSTGSANTYTATPTVSQGTVQNGDTLRFIVHAANTGASTVNGKAITKSGTTALASGDMPINSVATVTYDGTGYQLVSGAGGGGTALTGLKTFVAGTDFTAGSTTTLTLTSAPAAAANLYISFDGIDQHHTTWSLSGLVVTFSSAIPTGTAEVECAWTSSTITPYIGLNATIDVRSGDGSTVGFTMTGTPVSANAINIYVGGVYQQKSTYTWNGTTGITFSEAPPNVANNIEISWFAASANISTPADGSITDAKMAVTPNTANGHVKLDGSGHLPALDASALTNLPVQAGTPSPAFFKNLKITVTSNTAATLTADSVVLDNGAGAYKLVNSVSLTLGTGTSGANGLDTGSMANSTWYYVWAINNGTTTAVLISTSSTAPTMPSGYTYKARLGAVRTNGSAQLYRTIQYGRKARWVVDGTLLTGPPQMASGVAGTISSGTWVAVATGAFVPATASSVIVVSNSASANTFQIVVVPNNSYAGYTIGNGTSQTVGWQMMSQGYINQTAEIVLESSNIYWACSNANGTIQCYGWEDNI